MNLGTDSQRQTPLNSEKYEVVEKEEIRLVLCRWFCGRHNGDSFDYPRARETRR